MPLSRAATTAVLGLAVTFASACASTQATRPVPHPFPTPTEHTSQAEGRAPGPPDLAIEEPPSINEVPVTDALVRTALTLQGRPYRNGGTTLEEGFDCSGFTQYVFARHGIHLPREVRDQYRLGANVGRDDLAPGDLVFFTTTSPGPSHVAIALGGDAFVHAPSSRGVVRVEHMSTRYWASRLVGVRRIDAR